MPQGAILTNVGLSKISSATPLEQLNVISLAVGDGGGAFPPLSPGMISLTNEVWRGVISNPIRDPENPSILIFEAYIPADVGGFTIREQAIFDDAGDMIAIGHTAEVVKPSAGSETGVVLTMRMRIALSSSDQVDVFYSENPAMHHGALTNRDEAGSHPSSAISHGDQTVEFELSKKQKSAAEFIQSGGLPLAPPGTIVEFDEFYADSGVGGGKWRKTGVTGLTPSQTPAQVGAAKFTDSIGDEWELVYTKIKPRQLGARANISFDDGAVLELCLKILRETIPTTPNSGSAVSIDGEGLFYKTNRSINATKIVGWNYSIENMYLYGAILGKVVFDGVGSRGGTLRNFFVAGDKINQPTVGIQFARSSEVGFEFCDSWQLDVVGTLGHFSLTGFYSYGQESTHYNGCRFWNYNNTARAAVFTGSDIDIQTSSDYAAIHTGSTSYINNKYTAVDCRYLPQGNTATITDITNANPAVVTVSSVPDGWVNGSVIVIDFAGGMDEINNRKFTIANLSGNTFELQGVDSSAYGAYTSGGSVYLSATVSPVYHSRSEQHTFDNFYVVTYGQPHMEISFVDNEPIELLKINGLFEGSGCAHYIKFKNVTTNRRLIDFDLETYKTLATLSLIGSDSAGQVVRMDNSRISVTTNSGDNLDIFDNEPHYNLLGCDVSLPSLASIDTSSLAGFSGSVYESNSGTKTYINTRQSTKKLTHSPTVDFNTGSIGSFTVQYFSYKVVDGILSFTCRVDIPDVGTGTGFINVSLPLACSQPSVVIGRENAVTGNSLQAYLDGSTMQIRNIDGSSGFVSGVSLVVSGSFLV